MMEHTDLAVEWREDVGTILNTEQRIFYEEHIEENGEIRISEVRIEDDEVAKSIGRDKGCYITIEVPKLHKKDVAFQERIVTHLAKSIRLLPVWEQKNVLLVGIGNRSITSDALGPLCVEATAVNRHLHGINLTKSKYSISAIIPGVMAQTGMESTEIVRGVVAQTKPDLVIAIDALAARSVHRINSTIQISDTGIAPGSGLGNYRNALNKESLGVPCIAIGVPTVVSAATVVRDVLLHMHGNSEDNKNIQDEEHYGQYEELFVTAKNVDEEVRCLSHIISSAIEECYELIDSE